MVIWFTNRKGEKQLLVFAHADVDKGSEEERTVAIFFVLSFLLSLYLFPFSFFFFIIRVGK